ncbi:hypothetical protein HK096_009935 [Nowakowskiella sp. JEL0078]|nr:hypothetical protein HK096_009935 [Nowakowskiella sp. JEL0078]
MMEYPWELKKNGRADPRYKMEQTPDLTFLATYLKTSDAEALQKHVNHIWSAARASLHVYRCIDRGAFLYPRLPNHESYATVLLAALSSGNPLPRIADIGCCFGADVRRLLLDGHPPENITAIDLHDGYWKLGHQLFKDEAPLVDSFFADMAVEVDSNGGPYTQFIGKFDVVYSIAVLHVLSQRQSENLIKRVYGMLAPGGTYFGNCVGNKEAQDWAKTPNGGLESRFLQSKKSLTEILTRLGFVNVKVVEVNVPIVGTGDNNVGLVDQNGNAKGPNGEPENENLKAIRLNIVHLMYSARKT